MNQGRFDDLTRSLATSKISRARALKMVAAAAVGATLSSWGASMRSEEAAAKNTKNTKCNKDKQCPAGQFCVSGVCVDCRGDFDCPNPTPRFCLAGACECRGHLGAQAGHDERHALRHAAGDRRNRIGGAGDRR